MKSTRSILAGLLFIFLTHTEIDILLQQAGILPKGTFFVSTGLILFVLAYRIIFSILGCYITAKLAPQKPMQHALALGWIGVVLSGMGAFANMKLHLGPNWYTWALVILSLPCAWIGAKLFLKYGAK